MNNEKNKYYPIFLNIRGKNCVVVGGGEVAFRKVDILLGFGAEVKVISPDICPKLAESCRRNDIRTIARKYRAGDLNDAYMAIAATDDKEVNQMVIREAKEMSVLINVVDNAEGSDFIVPSYLQRGNITIAISSGGKSPALARKLRKKLESELGDEYALLAHIISEIRDEFKKQGIQVDAEIWQQALNLEYLISLLKKGEVERVKSVLLGKLKSK